AADPELRETDMTVRTPDLEEAWAAGLTEEELAVLPELAGPVGYLGWACAGLDAAHERLAGAVADGDELDVALARLLLAAEVKVVPAELAVVLGTTRYENLEERFRAATRRLLRRSVAAGRPVLAGPRPGRGGGRRRARLAGHGRAHHGLGAGASGLAGEPAMPGARARVPVRPAEVVHRETRPQHPRRVAARGRGPQERGGGEPGARRGRRAGAGRAAGAEQGAAGGGPGATGGRAARPAADRRSGGRRERHR